MNSLAKKILDSLKEEWEQVRTRDKAEELKISYGTASKYLNWLSENKFIKRKKVNISGGTKRDATFKIMIKKLRDSDE